MYFFMCLLLLMTIFSCYQTQEFVHSHVNNRTHLILASSTIRPGQTYKLSVSILQSTTPISVRASIKRYEVEISSHVQEMKPNVLSTMLLRAPSSALPGEYRLRVEGNAHGVQGGSSFVHERPLHFEQRSLTILISTERPLYHQGQTVRFRCVPLTTSLSPFGDSLDIHLFDARGNLVRRWLSRQSNHGAVNLEHMLSSAPAFGRWRIEVTAQGQHESHDFLVEEYYQTRFEVLVRLPTFASADSENIVGRVQANFTSGLPVTGNLTLHSLVTCGDSMAEKPIPDPDYWRHLRTVRQEIRLFQGDYEFRIPTSQLRALLDSRPLAGCTLTVLAEVGERFLNLIHSGQCACMLTTNALKLSFLGGGAQLFQPQMPLRVHVAVAHQDGSALSERMLNSGNLTLHPKVFFADGRVQSLATRTLYSAATFTNAAYRAWSANDTINSLPYGHIIDASVVNERDGRPQPPDVWQAHLQLREELSSLEQLLSVKRLHLEARYSNEQLQTSVIALLDVFSVSAGSSRALHISTSTVRPRVGQYLIVHVRANYAAQLVQYAIVAKGMLLQSGYERMRSSLHTFDVALSAEMAPAATLIVYELTSDGELVADALRFPLEALDAHKLRVSLNTRKDRTGDTLEFTVYGEPGAYVALGALDQLLLSTWPHAQLDARHVVGRMRSFEDARTSGGHVHQWLDRESGGVSRTLRLSAPALGVDTNRTFERAGLLVLTDARVYRRSEPCLAEQKLLSCLDGTRCYSFSQKCDRRRDCADGSDESDCEPADWSDSITSVVHSDGHMSHPAVWSLSAFRAQRQSRIQRLYESSWLWADVHIGPLGYFILRLPVPYVPALWRISAFSIGAGTGLSLLPAPLWHSSARAFRMTLEAPDACVIGEQVSLRASLFNELATEIEVLITLYANDGDVRFVHVEQDGAVSAYSPRTSTGQHQHLLLIKPRSSTYVHLPIVAQRLGNVSVRLSARTQSAQHTAERHFQVLADGVPQYMHSVALIDLSQGAQVIKYLHTNLTDTPIVPFQRERRYVFGSNSASLSAVGDVLGMPLSNMPLSARSLLRLPHAAGEQCMFDFAVNLYGLLYLRLSGQRNAELEKSVFAQLHVMYEQQLSFQRPDGAFRMFRWSDEPSVWLTAFCARILHRATFQEWEQQLYVQKRVIERAIAWILEHQAPDGSFFEPRAHAYDRKMSGGNFARWSMNSHEYRNVSLTAHVVITLAQIRDSSGELGARVATARWTAQRYLEGALHAVKRRPHPYELSIVTYALTLVNSVHADDGFNALDERMREVRGMRYWAARPVPPPNEQLESSRPYLLPRTAHADQALDVEATAYALLVHIHKQAVIQTEIVHWLNTYRIEHCGWSSTQDTLVALQALFEYSLRSRVREVTSIDLNVEAPAAANLSFSTRLAAANLPYMQTFNLPHAYGPVVVRASGAGMALVQLHVQYNVDWAHLQIAPPVPAFSLEVLMHSYGRNASHLRFHACQRWTAINEASSSGMAVLSVTVPTGYFVHQSTLDTYVRGNSVRNLREARFEQRRIEFYFDYLDSNDVCLSFTVQRWFPVANLTQYIYARVYDFYAPEKFNETLINAYNLHVLSVCHVCGSYQCPYCPAYSSSNLIVPSFLQLIIFMSIIILIRFENIH